jgi:hypothetical protein
MRSLFFSIGRTFAAFFTIGHAAGRIGHPAPNDSALSAAMPKTANAAASTGMLATAASVRPNA